MLESLDNFLCSECMANLPAPTPADERAAFSYHDFQVDRASGIEICSRCGLGKIAAHRSPICGAPTTEGAFEMWLKQPHPNNWNDFNHPLPVGERQAAKKAWDAALEWKSRSDTAIQTVAWWRDPSHIISDHEYQTGIADDIKPCYRPLGFVFARASSANETGAEGAADLAHELWSAAQLAPGEGIKHGTQRIAAILSSAPAQAAEAVAIPAGWKAMPPSATAAMRMAMAKAAAEYMQRTGGNSPDAIYEAAFAAAPQPAQADARVGLTDEQVKAVAEEHWSSCRYVDDECIYEFDHEDLMGFARAIFEGANQ
ncbi:hypothetical protein BJL96_12175 [Burkholderia cenocepacia]|nr:hypothetical protein [Burkholderia cenocepacia]